MGRQREANAKRNNWCDTNAFASWNAGLWLSATAAACFFALRTSLAREQARNTCLIAVSRLSTCHIAQVSPIAIIMNAKSEIFRRAWHSLGFATRSWVRHRICWHHSRIPNSWMLTDIARAQSLRLIGPAAIYRFSSLIASSSTLDTFLARVILSGQAVFLDSCRKVITTLLIASVEIVLKWRFEWTENPTRGAFMRNFSKYSLFWAITALLSERQTVAHPSQSTGTWLEPYRHVTRVYNNVLFSNFWLDTLNRINVFFAVSGKQNTKLDNTASADSVNET